jgi:hypothetical protein
MSRELTIAERKFFMASGITQISISALMCLGMIKTRFFTGLAGFAYFIPFTLMFTGIDAMQKSTKHGSFTADSVSTTRID